ncbi:MAG TPA: M48 family metallopeptidase [Desulfurivibrionaceae bacterium]|nr:M48 family metallopeptidase [Desulfurivibrionaceae bacterium]
MDFFAAQDQARRNTGRLVLFFALAVVSLVVMTNLLVMVLFGYFRPGALPFDWQLFFSIGAVVVLLVTAGSLYKIAALSGGGDAVAAMLGGEPIFGDEGDLDRRKVINVVEEMAIASGTPVPQVYLLKEEGINAFAAGFSTSDAVIGVTSGAIRQLNREQLQGVIAHEFSHILNGDMRLNIRLIGILHGILLLGLLGYRILRGISNTHNSRKGGGPLIFLGLGLVAIGYAGTFFGKLIKAAVSRQREFLADAAAVQFTRNPQGIGGALLRIGASPTGSLLKNPKSAEISHFFFSQGVTVYFAALFATHPPLAERIRRIMPGWEGQFPAVTGSETVAVGSGAAAKGVEAEGMISGLVGAAVVASVGQPTEAHLGYARQLLREIPEVLHKAARDPFSARALICYLVLDGDQAIRTGQLLHLKNSADRGVYVETLKLLREGGRLLPEHRLPLVDLTLPTLRRLSEPQYRRFLDNLKTLMAADGKISLFEWCLRKIVMQHLAAAFGKPAGRGSLSGGLDQVAGSCVVLLSVLVHAVEHQGLMPAEVFAAARSELGLAIELAPRERLGLGELDRALRELQRLQPLLKAKLLKACAACVTADGRIAPVEAELLRAVAATLDCPMPPLAV